MKYDLFKTEQDKTFGFSNGSVMGGEIPLLVPNGNGRVNIRDEYRWDLNMGVKAKQNVAPVILTEYVQSVSSAAMANLAQMAAWRKTVTGPFNAAFGSDEYDVSSDFDNPYSSMYKLTPTKWSYVLPYVMGDVYLSTSAKWVTQESDIGKLGGAVMDAFSKTAGKGSGNVSGSTSNTFATIRSLISGAKKNVVNTVDFSEMPRTYAPPQEGSNLDVNFRLFNTMDVKDVKRNWEFVYLFTNQNLFIRRTINEITPPVLYKITIPGFRSVPLCYVESFTATPLGQMRYYRLDQNDGKSLRQIPEAYDITIKFKEIFVYSQNIHRYLEDYNNLISVT
jgi:hypothetical protein